MRRFVRWTCQSIGQKSFCLNFFVTIHGEFLSATFLNLTIWAWAQHLLIVR